MLCLSLLTAAAVAVARGASAAYCDDNLFRGSDGPASRQPRSTDVQFTKELSAAEYGPLNSFKTLHCCAERYLSLEWFKDNRPYPWPSDVSSFILNPESANQTIYTRSLTSSDHGIYTCQVANQTNIVNHSIELVTIDVKSYWGDPLPTYKMPIRHYAQPGDSVRLYCEGFVGQINLPDAVNTITWKRIDGNQTFGPREKYRIEEVIRENTQVLGAFLFINKLEESDYGQYMCSISNTDDQIVHQFTNITKPVINKKQSYKKRHKDLKLITIVVLALMLIVWKHRWFHMIFLKLKKKFENDKYTLSEKTVHSVIVFYNEENKESAQYLLEKMDFRDNFIIKKYHTDFGEKFMKEHMDLIKGYDFAIYVLSSITSSVMIKALSLIQDNVMPKKYIIDCGNMPVTPTKLCCDRVLVDLDLNSEHSKINHQNMQNKLIRAI